MIVSASRRTDIPAVYADWFFHRLSAGFALVRNPMRFHQVSKVDLSRESVDGFVFWTKNPAPMLPHLGELNGYPYYFQYTLTAYDRDIEPHIPQKIDGAVQTFCRLADLLGPQRVIWRYDPILLSEKYSVAWHVDAFGKLASMLRGFTDTCVFSFVDPYRNTARNEKELALIAMTAEDKRMLAKAFAHIAAENGLLLSACAEDIDLGEYGIGHARCVDAQRLSFLGGRTISAAKDKNQRPACGCAASVDIGAYNTCPLGCLYCYANYNSIGVKANIDLHDPQSPLLIGNLSQADEVRERMR